MSSRTHVVSYLFLATSREGSGSGAKPFSLGRALRTTYGGFHHLEEWDFYRSVSTVLEQGAHTRTIKLLLTHDVPFFVKIEERVGNRIHGRLVNRVVPTIDYCITQCSTAICTLPIVKPLPHLSCLKQSFAPGVGFFPRRFCRKLRKLCDGRRGGGATIITRVAASGFLSSELCWYSGCKAVTFPSGSLCLSTPDIGISPPSF